MTIKKPLALLSICFMLFAAGCGDEEKQEIEYGKKIKIEQNENNLVDDKPSTTESSPAAPDNGSAKAQEQPKAKQKESKSEAKQRLEKEIQENEENYDETDKAFFEGIKEYKDFELGEGDAEMGHFKK